MNWLEIIELRTVNTTHDKLEAKLKSLFKDFHNSATDRIIKVYNRFSLESDISIHLLHQSDKPVINGSPEGMQLASALKEFGLTNHSIWIEKSGDKK
jgi:hypothetical protein